MMMQAPPPRPRVPGAPVKNAMTIDVEDYFQVSAFAPNIDRASWDSRECRVERNIDVILRILAEGDVKATFFTLGWIAERYPQVVRAIVAGGHELASHGYGHLRASDQSRAEFFEDISSARKILEDIGGVQVKGYRAPSFSIGHRNLWALEALQEAGYRYSSSIYPIAHDHYGMPDAPRFAFYPFGPDGLLEVPITTVELMNRKLPAGGGGYFRLLPYSLSRWMMRRVNRMDEQSAIFYFHPWEIDPGQPRPDGASAKARFRHYVNLERMEGRIRQLTRDFAWERMDKLFLPD
jgi:polysaccharide deacetylase family protein (PEP-CTERM system associated)